MISRVTRLTCAGCGEQRRVKVQIIGGEEFMPTCPACGPTAWLNAPKLEEPKPRPVDQLMPLTRRVLSALLHPGFSGRHAGCESCTDSGSLAGDCWCECHRRI